MNGLRWWMRAVGALYVFLFVAAAILRLPIQVEGPEGVLALAAGGDPVARFVVDTWVTFGIYLGAVGVATLIASKAPERATALVWTLIAMESGGIVVDVYKLGRGFDPAAPVTWIVIHSVIIATGLLWLRRAQTRTV
jgi:hypothetical protein